MGSKGMFYLSDHQGKGKRYAEALVAAGYERTDYVGNLDEYDGPKFCIYDHDCGPKHMGYRNGLSWLKLCDIPVFLYPHTARPFVQYDHVQRPWPHTRAMITIAAAHKEIMDVIGYPCPVEVCGWAMCDIKPWKKRTIPKRKPLHVLFGPIHPNGNGWLSDVDRRLNREAFCKLLSVPNINLTVRHIKRVDLSGIWKEPGVHYLLAKPDGSTREIDAADVIVAHQTMAFLAVARGKPVVMFGDKVAPRSGNDERCFKYGKRYGMYRHLMQYPMEIEDVADGNALREMMERAISEDVGAAWRERMIGEPFDPEKFVGIIENYLTKEV